MSVLHTFRKMAPAVFLWALAACSGPSAPEVTVRGEARTWHTLTLSFAGPDTDESALPNPFLNYRMEVAFALNGDTLRVPGFFAADGQAAESSATGGSVWQVRFCPPEAGTWTYAVSFREGHNLAVSPDPAAGTPVAFDGATGSLAIEASDKTGRDVRARGRLEYVGKRYYRFAGSGEYFLKGGTDSPENLLACADFDGTYKHSGALARPGEDDPGQGLHRYESHRADWHTGDPVWQGDTGKGLIGALNYLAGEGVNSAYFLTMNVLGDGDDVWPWTSREERYRFDCSRLDQWERVFSHMDSLGILLHVVLQETENECLLDGGQLDVQRKLYLRELVARFAHHPAIVWNIGEENGPAFWTPVGQTVPQRKAMMSHLREVNPYPSLIVCHTHAADPYQNDLIRPFLGFPDMDGPSLQMTPPDQVHAYTGKWIRLSEEAGRPWVVSCDEQGPHWKGAMPDATDPDHDTIRADVLWGNLMAGGAGVEWYFGYQYAHADLGCEDFRSRHNLWNQTRLALDFFRDKLPFPAMDAHDELADGGLCFAQPGQVYLLYLPDGGPARLDLSGSFGMYAVSWFNPRGGGDTVPGRPEFLDGGDWVSTGPPPVADGQDWVCLIRAVPPGVSSGNH
ncbi:MAG: DUF5060 domain-containing protein [Bacteroidales bacterium]